ncbi:hypothetical protein E3N88_25337 [Mikania micrantha]|uniref:Ribulose bisphosphate carboxylase large chain n=1 Tax=Mikania micrantha TaxID=192012 RepID=A0A5N6N4G9_9ASTR|nr:hypothetical protein E3N88_25337 [Mikania micrantha]
MSSQLLRLNAFRGEPASSGFEWHFTPNHNSSADSSTSVSSDLHLVSPKLHPVVSKVSTGTWTTVWTDGLTSLDRYKGRCYGIEPVPGEDNQYIAYVAYPLDLFEEGSVTNMFTSIVGGFTANTTLAHYCRDNGLLLHIHRAMHAVIDRQKNHDRSRGIYFTQDWVSLPGVLPVASGGIHVWHMPALTEIFGDDSVLQFGGGTLGHPWGNAPGAVANRVALEACVQARNEGRDLATEGNEIIREAAKWSPELAAACEVWKEIKFEFQAMDTLDTDKDKDKKR